MRGRSQIVTLLTDFGAKDAYVGAMKGAILEICPEAIIIDISHEVARHNVLEGAFILSQASPYFPEGSVHLAVVDPGVGTERRRIIVKGSRSLYVGPDNGVLSLAAEKEGVVKVFEIKNEKFMLPHPSRTFEGRDIFAPTAAYLARGVDIEEFGPEIKGFTGFSIPKPEKWSKKLRGEIIHTDNFGNITTNIPEDMFGEFAEGKSIKVSIGKISKNCPLCRAYGEVSAGSPLIIPGSSGFIEVAVNQGSAEKLFKARVGGRIVFSHTRQVGP